MKRILLLILALVVIAGGAGLWVAVNQSDDSAESVAATPEAAAPTTQTVADEAGSSTEAAATTEAAARPDTARRIQVAQVDLSAVEAAGFVEGRNYELISPVQPTGSPPGQVEVDEFFMHSCIHCYHLEPYVEAWLEKKPDYINFVRIPTTWDAIRVFHAQAFYAAESLEITDEIMMPFFEEFHDKGNYLETPEKLASFFGRFGVSKEDFESHFNSFSVNTKVNRANELGNRYKVGSTPTIVINGKYKTGVDQAGSYDELFELIELLAAAERGQ